MNRPRAGFFMPRHMVLIGTGRGSVPGIEMRLPATGHWAITGNRLCLSVHAEAPANCTQVGYAGKNRVLRDNGMNKSDLRVAPYGSSKQWE